jgi:hypothetical protein
VFSLVQSGVPRHTPHPHAQFPVQGVTGHIPVKTAIKTFLKLSFRALGGGVALDQPLFYGPMTAFLVSFKEHVLSRF